MVYYGEQKREYQRRWLANRREKAIDRMGGQCVKCESTEDLEFDHIDPETKTLRISEIWSHKWDSIWIELDKCQLLCSTCHKDKSVSEAVRNICQNGHDKNRTGRDTDGKCSECRRNKDRRLRAEGKKI